MVETLVEEALDDGAHESDESDWPEAGGVELFQRCAMPLAAAPRRGSLETQAFERVGT